MKYSSLLSFRSLLVLPLAASLAFSLTACNESGDSKSGQSTKSSKKGTPVSEAVIGLMPVKKDPHTESLSISGVRIPRTELMHCSIHITGKLRPIIFFGNKCQRNSHCHDRIVSKPARMSIVVREQNKVLCFDIVKFIDRTCDITNYCANHDVDPSSDSALCRFGSLFSYASITDKRNIRFSPRCAGSISEQPVHRP